MQKYQSAKILKPKSKTEKEEEKEKAEEEVSKCTRRRANALQYSFQYSHQNFMQKCHI